MTALDNSYPISYDGSCPGCGSFDVEVWDISNPHDMRYQCLQVSCREIFVDRSPIKLPTQSVPDPATDTDVEGVWAIIDRDYFEFIGMVFPDEISALRALNGRGYGRVAFIEYGKELP